MTQGWTFRQKVIAGFGIIAGLAAITSAVAVWALRAVVVSKDQVITVNARSLVDAAKLNAAADQQVASFRGFLLTGENRFLESRNSAQQQFAEALDHLRGQVHTGEGKRLLAEIERAQPPFDATQDRTIALRASATRLEPVIRLFEAEVVPARNRLQQHVQAFVDLEERLLEEEKRRSTEAAATATRLAVLLAAAAAAAAVLLAFFLTRTLSRQIGSAVQHVQSSATELQTAANQQATGAKEASTAMNEIGTTTSELLATSRQIAESAQRVAHIAQDTAGAARTGDHTLQKTQEAIAGIRRQVDIIVGHMLDLGRKSQQIGAILEIINELAEQTNILAINATIEAAGAGEAGKRFAVVGDEVRKLADRVAGSTKDIRELIEEVRAAVNTTVMATEGGSKAVDAGLRDFAEAASSFRQIGALVAATTEAAREIELSTKQQTTAVEQVNLAIGGAGQATRETEASSTQTLQTATQLAGLSRDLSRLIQPQRSA